MLDAKAHRTLAARQSPDPPFASLYPTVTKYMEAHELSAPSYRYVYILWFFFLGVGALLGLERLLSVGDRTIIGTLWYKWSTHNLVFRGGRDRAAEERAARRAALEARTGGRQQSGAQAGGAEAMRRTQRKAFLTINLGRFTVLLLLFGLVLCLTLIGADYISPHSSIFGSGAAFPGPKEEQAARQAREKRAVHWGQGDFPPVLFKAPDVTLPYHAWWTMGDRTGDFCNALTPFVILLAMKQMPVALVSLPVFGSFSVDVLNFLHRWGGRLIWVYATAHTITWAVQLRQDKLLGKNLWHWMPHIDRFRWALVAYVFLTLLVVFSVEWFRSRYYEAFYIIHIVCVIGFMVGTWAHHPVIGWWMLAGFIIWAAERAVRLARTIYINYSVTPPAVKAQRGRGAFQPLETPRAPSAGFQFAQSTETLTPRAAGPDASGDMDVSAAQLSSFSLVGNESAAELPHPDSPDFAKVATLWSSQMPYLEAEGTASSESMQHYQHPRHASGPLSSRLAPRSAASSRLDLEAGAPLKSPDGSVAATPQLRPAPPPMPEPAPGTIRAVISSDLRNKLYPGFAFVQPLAGETLRFVLRTAAPMTWRPGQWVYLRLPELSWIQSHPFTIACSYAAQRQEGAPEAVQEQNEDRVVVFLVRARRGLTRRLWEHVQRACARAEADVMQSEQQAGKSASTTTFPLLGGEPIRAHVSGVYMRTIVDGPFGSCARIDWGAYKSVLILCGGSGVAFGLAALEYLCRKVAKALAGEPVHGKYGRPFQVRHIRFVWVVREFAHLQWAASTLRYCLELLPPEYLRVQMFVTYINQRQVAPPRTNPYASGVSAGGMSPTDEDTAPRGDGAALFAAHGDYHNLGLTVNDLTRFENEDTQALSAFDRMMNALLLKEGKLRRARTRRRTQRKRDGADARARIAARAADRRSRALESHAESREEAPTGLASHAEQQAQEELYSRQFAQRVAQQRFKQAAEARPGLAQLAMAGGAVPGAGDAGAQWSAPSPGPVSPSEAVSPDGGVSPGAEPQDYFSLRRDGESIPMHPLSSPGTGEAPGEREQLEFVNLDPQEAQDLEVVSELARAGYPHLDEILREERETAQGRVLTVGCGPPGLAALMRSVVSEQIDLRKVWKGDWTGHVSIYTESFES